MSSARTSQVSLTKVLRAMDFSPATFTVSSVGARMRRHYGGEVFVPRVHPLRPIAPLSFQHPMLPQARS